MNGKHTVVPLQDIPSYERRPWKELIGFDAQKDYLNVEIGHCYDMRIWARTGTKLRELPLPQDPLDATRSLPHKSVLNFDRTPVQILPVNVMLENSSSLSEAHRCRKSTKTISILPNKSKCDCPNGWLFCSHSLAYFLLFHVIQVKKQWSFDDLLHFMPQSIKLLQNLPIPAAMVFKSHLKKASKIIGRQLAKECPGYSAQQDNCKDNDEQEETAAQHSGLAGNPHSHQHIPIP
uniref:SWIM-type domain-containing protein n=2 Tax=Pseudictyota dubia TaxID=2749911 RepID=A0A6U2A7Q9_9STRA|mmetsp:Transcript_13440/g.25111  ORF Transcript_13440/g.25111 Transcript_13440/m.25111 type:complete len:234 (+) Transcript_13440:691-1392(+)